MYKRSKWGQLVLHIGFVVVALGALITRYVGYEGVLHLREGGSTNKMVSDYMALTLAINKEGKEYLFDRKMVLSSMTNNTIHNLVKVEDKEINVELLDYLPSVSKGLKEVKGGDEFLELMAAPAEQRGQITYLQKDKKLQFGAFNLLFGSGEATANTLVIQKDSSGKLVLKTPLKIVSKSMDTLQNKELPAGSYTLQPRTLYQVGNSAFVFKKYYKNAKLDYVSSSLKSDSVNPQMIKLKLTSGKDSKVVTLFGKSGEVGKAANIKLNGLDIALRYGAKVISLPFSVRLDKFKLERYPGSMSPSSYSSWVSVNDPERKNSFKYHIFMNHVLDYRGFRFFQSSFDPDEKGSVLSVNHDPGTLPTYIGYLMLVIGFIWSFLSKKGRVAVLLRKLEKLDKKALASVAALFFVLINFVPLQAGSIDASLLSKSELKTLRSIDLNHSEKFARLIVQDNGGRMEPLDTLALDVVRKISKKRSFLGLNYNQIFIGMLIEPDIYNKLRMVKIGHPLLAKKLGLPKGAKYAAFEDFFAKGSKGEYKIVKDVEKAKKKRAAQRDEYDKELIKADEKLNVIYLVEQGYLLKLFPKPNDPTNTWYNPIEAVKAFPVKEGQVVRYIISSYLKSAVDATKSGNWTKAGNAIDIITNFQKFYGSKIIPSKKKIEAEIFYNRLGLFSKISFAYMTIGVILLLLAFIAIVKPKLNLKLLTNIFVALLVVTFLLHTFGIGLRWYIAEHAPWSNSYESILYIGWATALAGFVFAKRSPLAFAATSILAGIFLLVAFISSLNPQITNLVPVLKSYWLMIHVAVTTASYGFFALGALLAIFTLILMISQGINKKEDIKRAIKELTIINEITLLIGLALLTVGTFLGGVWANESWGRYWGWDSKETWAAVTILVYAAVVHMRFIPKLNSIYAYNVASLLAYFSVIMTYFGVNYYLTGLHSYAAGDPVPIPAWVYPAVASVFILIAAAWPYRVKGKM